MGFPTANGEGGAIMQEHGVLLVVVVWMKGVWWW
jgi:hypothetical protein